VRRPPALLRGSVPRAAAGRALLLCGRLLGGRRLHARSARGGLRAGRAARDHGERAPRPSARQPPPRGAVRLDADARAPEGVQGLGRRRRLSRLPAVRGRTATLLLVPPAPAGRLRPPTSPLVGHGRPGGLQASIILRLANSSRSDISAEKRFSTA